jgi:threonylcarbamoyladenosine tRNA methylthiotransferase MtaB
LIMKIYLDTVGCRLNQSEIEAYARQFRQVGHELVSDPNNADLVVINTCAVTAQAASDSRQKIRQVQRVGAARTVVTGCWSTLQPEAAAALPGVSQVIANPDKDRLVPLLLEMPEQVFDLEPVERQPLPGARMRTRAFIKAQDGCDNRCTFCVTTLARGPGRSRTAAQVIADVQAALQGGAQEVVLTGVHLGSWGQDLGEKLHLRHLVQAVLRETEIPRLRLSSLEPWDLDAAFFELWQDERVCRHLHLPLQSGSAATLRRMARKTTPHEFAKIVSAARSLAPDIAITTDIIVGFPGESEPEFQESLGFVQNMSFAGGHVFTYSARQGTAAARMMGQVPQAVRKQRNAQMRAVLAESAAAYRSAFSGQVLEVLWESATALHADGWQLTGLTGNYLRVSALAPQRLWNQITPVRLIEQRDDGFWGRLQLTC